MGKCDFVLEIFKMYCTVLINFVCPPALDYSFLSTAVEQFNSCTGLSLGTVNVVRPHLSLSVRASLQAVPWFSLRLKLKILNAV